MVYMTITCEIELKDLSLYNINYTDQLGYLSGDKFAYLLIMYFELCE